MKIRSMGAAKGTLTTAFIIACHASSYHVNSFSHPAATRRRPTPKSLPRWQQKNILFPPSVKIFGKRPRYLVPTESDLEDSQLKSAPFWIDTQSNGANLTNKEEEKTLEDPPNNDDSNSNPLLKKLFLGIEPTPDIIAICTIYFVEGALALAYLAQTFLLKDELHLGPAEMSATMGILVLPWTIKPVYGFLSDGFPIFGYRRRSYLVLAGVVGFLSYSSLAWGLGGGEGGESGSSGISSNSMALTVTLISLLLSSASIALADVVADGIVVQKTRDAANNGDDPAIAGGLQSLCWGSASIGALISAYFSGSLLESMSPREVFGIASVLPLAVGAMSFLIEEEPIQRKKKSEMVVINGSNGLAENAETSVNGEDIATDDAISSIKEQISSLWDALRQPSLWRPMLFIFLWKATPTSDGAMLYFLTDDIGFGPEFLGRVSLVTAASSLFGVWLYNQYLRRVAIKDILLWTSIISAPLGLTQLLLITHYNRVLGIPDGAFVFGDDVVLSILGKYFSLFGIVK